MIGSIATELRARLLNRWLALPAPSYVAHSVGLQRHAESGRTAELTPLKKRPNLLASKAISNLWQLDGRSILPADYLAGFVEMQAFDLFNC